MLDNGRKYNSSNKLEKRMDHALKSLGDRSELSRSPLANTDFIGELALKRYSSHLMPRGLALHDVLLTCVNKISTELSNEPGLSRACTYLQLLVQGFSCKEISRQLGLSREHVSRVYRKKALTLLTEEFQSMVGNRG